MKKILLAILIITLLAVISGCFLFRTKSVENSEFHAVIKDGELDITSKNAYPGIEISLKGIYEEENIITSQEHLRIVFHKDGITKIAIVSTKGNIQSGILLVRVKGDFKSIQELDIQSTVGYLSDSGGNSVKENNNWVVADTTPVLLGDFNDNGNVDLTDFINFARKYGSVDGDDKYEVKYDISPAEKAFGGDWENIYSICTPDGKVDLLDFIIFARNYGKYKPEDPGNMKPVVEKTGGNEGEIASDSNTFGWNGTDQDGEIIKYEYRKDNGEWTDNGTDTSYTWTGYSIGEHTFEVRAQDNGGLYSDIVKWSFKYIYAGVYFYEDFETGDLSANPWVVSGDYLPFVQSTEVYEGNHSLSFLPEYNNEDRNVNSTIEATVTLPTDAYLSFYRKVSGRFEGDVLTLSIDGVEAGSWTSFNVTEEEWWLTQNSDLEWSEVVRRLPAGTHHIEWTYSAYRYSQSNGSDTSWIDRIMIVNNMDLGEVISFPDSRIDQYIRMMIGKAPSEEIRAKEVQDVCLALIYAEDSSMAQSSRESIIGSGLFGIEHSSSINTFEEQESVPFDLTGMQYCTDLFGLLLDGAEINNIDVLSQCEQLQVLALYPAKLVSTEALNNLGKLRYVMMEGEANLTGLLQNQNLRALYINAMNILPDFSVISNAQNLELLEVNNCGVEDVSPVEPLVNLSQLNLWRNNITSIEPLVNNTGLGSGDDIYLRYNYLDLTPGSTDMQHIQTLQNRGATVYYDPQRQPLIAPYSPSPTDGATNVSVVPTLSWECGEGFSYDVYIYLDPAGDPVRSVTDLTQTSYSVPNDQLLNESTTYYWKVIASDGENEASSPMWSFTTGTMIVVNFADANLEQAVRDAIGKQEGPIYAHEVDQLEELNASSRNISDLSGIEYLANLRNLNVYGNQISDLTPLSNLYCLEWLILWSNNISTLAPISNLTNLVYIDVDSNNISDLTPLSGLSKLNSLYVSYNQISDLSPIIGLTNLRVLGIGYNPITDITQLAQMTWLEDLRINGVNASDISFITPLQNLIRLYVYNNEIEDISPLLQMSNLQYLNIGANPISNIELIGNMTQLRYLRGSYLGLSDISFVSSLVNLDQLTLNNNNISDISPISNLTGLQYLYLHNNEISSITDLQASKFSTYDELPDNDLPLMEEHDYRYYCEEEIIESSGGNQIYNIQALSGLVNLRVLYLDTNHIDDISPLINLVELYSLRLETNNITSIEPLVNNIGLGSGDTIYLGENYLDLTPGSTDMQNIQTLQNRGATVYYTPQRQPLVAPYNPSPTDGATNVSVGPVLSWECGEGFSYDVYIYLDPAGDPVRSVTDLTQTSYSIPNDQLLNESTTYYWKVIASDGTNEVSSPMWSFTTGTMIVVNFADANLEQAVRDAIGKQEGPIYAHEVDQLEELEARLGNVIYDLSGIEYLTNLRILDIYGNRVSDLTPLSNLSNLEELHAAGGNNISSLSPILGLTNLRFLDIGYNPITDITQLAQMTWLEDLRINGINASDISFITPLQNLIRLYVYDNEIEDISPLLQMSNLQYLDIGANPISNIELIGNMTQLRYLSGSYLGLSDISFVSSLVNLYQLTLNNNNISDISPISNLTGLLYLHLHNNEISSITDLQASKFSTYDELPDNDLPLMEEHDYRYYCEEEIIESSGGNQIYDIQALSGLVNLRVLYLDTNHIDDISPLENMVELYYLRLETNNITSLEPLVNNVGLGSGDRIYLRYNYLDLTQESTDMQHIQTLQNRGATVYYDPQRQSLVAPHNPSPTDGATNVSVGPTLSWECGEGFTYDVYIYLDPSGNPVRAIENLTQTSYSVPNDQLLNESTTYYWKVVASDGTNEVSSPMWSFTTGLLVVVNFADANLEQAVRDAIGKQEGPIYAYEVDQLEELEATWRNISDLSGIEYLSNLKYLNVNGNQISDLMPLSNLSNLVHLDAYANDISSLMPISNLTNLVYIYADSNNISDLSPLSGLSNLNTLLVSLNQISDLSPIIGLTNLRALDIGYNPITDITQLAQMTSLTELVAWGNELSDISFIGNLINLTWLDLNQNQISDLSPLSNLTNLTNLSVWGNEIIDISFIGSLINLTRLDLSLNQISDLSPLSNLTGLEYLFLGSEMGPDDFKANEIYSIEALSSLTNLRVLDLGYNYLEDISPLENLINLCYLNLQRNNITSIEPLVNNAGLGSGDDIYLEYNYLDLTPGSTDMQHIQTLQNRGATVYYDPQRQPLVAPYSPLPTDGATNVSVGATLSWECGEGFSYDVYIYLDPSGEPVRSITDLTQTSYSIPDDQPLNESTTYYWKVIASDGANEVSSPVWSFTTGALVEVVFADDNLRQLIRNVIDKQQGPIYAHEVDDISYFGAFNQGISNLTGIEYLISLEHLDLCWNNINDISPLGYLDNLVTLELWDNQISDISPLENLTKLESLNLQENGVSDLVPLSSLTNLSSLCLWRNEIVEISPLSNLTNLEMLLIGSNEISNLTPLLSLKKLKVLWVGDNPISDITQLSSMTWLEYLFVDALNLSDISFVASLTNLSKLRMSYNQITDISALSSLVNLNWLDLSNNQISDIEPLSNLVNLEYLYLGMNSISGLNDLEVTHNGLDHPGKSFEEKFKLYSSELKSREVNGTNENSKSNKIYDLESISELVNLKELDVSDNFVEDINAVESLVSLDILQIQRNRVDSIESIVNNTGIGSGDQVIISENYLDLTPGSTDMQNIETLQNRGVYVSYTPQKLLISPFDPSPTDGATDVSFAPSLSWLCTGATTYDVYIYLDPSGEPVRSILDLTQTSYSVPNDQLLNESTTYYWKVIASDGENEASSPVWSFTTRIPVEVVFVDPNLEQAVRDAIEKQSGAIYDYEVEGISELNVSERNIANLSGIEYLIGLTHLYLNWNQIQDLSPVSNLANLFLLYVEGNQITDLTPILGMTNLEMISVGNNPLNDITQVTAMRWLGELVASSLGIDDLSFISQLPNLYGLHIHFNDVSDISPLVSMNNIEYLGMSWNPVQNIELIATMRQLRYLSISGYGISDISFLENMTNLYQLDIRYNNISDLSPIENLTNILYLYLGHNNLTEISQAAIENSASHVRFCKDDSIEETPLFDLNFDLSPVDVCGDGLEVQSLAGLVNLLILDLEYNLIEDITPLENLTRLYEMSLKGNRITTIEPLVNNTGLGSGDTIHLQENYLDLTPGSTDMQHLQTLQNRGATVYYDPQRQPLVAPHNPSPTDGATNVTVAPILSWECTEGLEYSIYIYLDPEDEPVKSFLGLLDIFYYIASDDLLRENTTYYWRVVVTNGSDELSGPMWSFTTNSPVEITFADKALEGIVRDTIGKPTGAIYDYEVDHITQLTAVSEGIGDLSGLEYLINLQVLQIISCSIADLTPIAQLVNLEVLMLVDNLITDITPLSNLTKLMFLLLGNDLEPIVGAKYSCFEGAMIDPCELQMKTSGDKNSSNMLYFPSATGNSISDISPLAGLVGLRLLALEQNIIEDISALANLTDLELLELSNNNITDITPLIENEGIGNGDQVYLNYNYLDLQTGSDDLLNIEALEGRGATVIYEPQKQP